MKNHASRLWSRSHLVALGLGVALALGLGGAGCTLAPDDPAASEPTAPAAESALQASSAAIPAAFQIVFQCFTPDGTPVGLPKSPLSACRAACPSGDTCVRCVFQNNALECP
jgi:hypothetical protein